MSHIHIWTYWIYIKDNAILLIKKARWPYIWMYDLPGWWIEFWESIDECLKRELVEETWTQLLHSDFIGKNEYICDYITPQNKAETSHHIGFYYSVDLWYTDIKTTPDWEDSLGAEFIELSELSNITLSPIAEPMIQKVIHANSEFNKGL